MPDRSEALRKAYATKILRLAGVADSRLEAAFAAVPREKFAGPPPWRVSGGLFGFSQGVRDVAALYDDVLVAIDAARGVNNGQPSLHVRCLSALAVGEGETVVHVGAGAGYYTAVLARLVGPSGRIVAYEIEADIAARARANLADLPQVEVRAGSGVAAGLPQADVVTVNAAASHPVRAWLDALKPGGRLLFPLQATNSSGAMLLVTRPREGGDDWPARLFGGVVFIACEGAQDAAMGRRLDAAFRRGGAERVRRLRLGPASGVGAWLAGDGWALVPEVATAPKYRAPTRL